MLCPTSLWAFINSICRPIDAFYFMDTVNSCKCSSCAFVLGLDSAYGQILALPRQLPFPYCGKHLYGGVNFVFIFDCKFLLKRSFHFDCLSRALCVIWPLKSRTKKCDRWLCLPLDSKHELAYLTRLMPHNFVFEFHPDTSKFVQTTDRNTRLSKHRRQEVGAIFYIAVMSD